VSCCQSGQAREDGREIWLMFGITEEQLSGFGMTFGLAAFMLFMLFIIGELAWKSKAGRTGTVVLFVVLAFGMLGFVAKSVIQFFWGM
jgi:Protein of unknown function (DUF2788)